MPRFSPEQVPNALQEQMWRQMLNEAMFNKEPMSGEVDLEEFNSNFPPNYVPPGPNEFTPQDMGPYRTLRPEDPVIQALRDADNEMMRQRDEEAKLPYDRLPPSSKYDDTQTPGQRSRTDKEMLDSQLLRPRTPTINPMQRPADPKKDDLDALFPDYSLSEPNVSTMEKLYRRMPMSQPPNASGRMMTPQEYQMYNVPKQYEQPDLDTMQQLQDFYAGGSEI